MDLRHEAYTAPTLASQLMEAREHLSSVQAEIASIRSTQHKILGRRLAIQTTALSEQHRRRLYDLERSRTEWAGKVHRLEEEQRKARERVRLMRPPLWSRP